jgi:hypothetical protein
MVKRPARILAFINTLCKNPAINEITKFEAREQPECCASFKANRVRGVTPDCGKTHSCGSPGIYPWQKPNRNIESTGASQTSEKSPEGHDFSRAAKSGSL